MHISREEGARPIKAWLGLREDNIGLMGDAVLTRQVLDIEAPENYSEKSVLELAARVEEQVRA